MNSSTDNADQSNQTPTGYLHPGYVGSLAEFGTPCELTQCGGWVLQRQIPGFPYRDAMGCYPLFVCRDWSKFPHDLEKLGDQLVSLALVTDPFGEYDESYLRQCFDVVIPFKSHFVIDCSLPMNRIVSKNHQYQARRAFKDVHVEKCEEPALFLEEWVTLYSVLIQRHKLKGFHALSKEAFAKQLKVPGLIMLRAVYQDITVGAILSFSQGEVGYAHLVAVNELGYKLGVSYALYWRIIEHLIGKVSWLSIGASAGISSENGDGGLDFFKRGWSTETRPTYFCGRLFDHAKYSEIVKATGVSATDYFPAYRKGEFG